MLTLGSSDPFFYELHQADLSLTSYPLQCIDRGFSNYSWCDAQPCTLQHGG